MVGKVTPENGKLKVQASDLLDNRQLHIDADMVVLAAAIAAFLPLIYHVVVAGWSVSPGYDTAFAMGAMFAGFAGSFFATRQGFVSPESFTFAESAFVLAIVVLGGMGSQFAVILAAILLVVSRELMRDFNEYSMLMLGGLMVLMMIWRPQGLLPMTRPQLKLKNGQAKGEQA